MEHLRHRSELMGKHYYGSNPCIHPLIMAELMIRLENRRKHDPSTQQPSNLFSRMQTILVNLLP